MFDLSSGEYLEGGGGSGSGPRGARAARANAPAARAVADELARVVADVVEVGDVPVDGLAAVDREADELLRDALLLDGRERVLADERVFVEVDLPAEAALVGVVLDVDVAEVAQDPRLDAAVVARRDHLEPELLALLEDVVPARAPRVRARARGGGGGAGRPHHIFSASRVAS